MIEQASSETNLCVLLSKDEAYQSFERAYQNVHPQVLDEYFATHEGVVLSPNAVMSAFQRNKDKTHKVLKECLYLRRKNDNGFSGVLEKQYAQVLLRKYGELSHKRALSKQEFESMKSVARLARC